MHEHGVQTPPVNTSGRGSIFRGRVNFKTPQFRAAFAACRSYALAAGAAEHGP
jgi:hypothetical protein